MTTVKVTTVRPWDDPRHDIRADLEAAARFEPEPFRPTEYPCATGHRLVLCIGGAALVEHVKQAHPEQARELGWLQ